MLNLLSILFAGYFFCRHNSYCEPGSKLLFGNAYKQFEELHENTPKLNGSLTYLIKVERNFKMYNFYKLL